jgi:pantetheine-phosphate adenylyltransferase
MTRKAIYPGSFDPITNGHIDIVNRATEIFDEVTIVVFDNPNKTTLFSFEERRKLISEQFCHLANVTVDVYRGLLVDYAKQKSIFTIIRGLRALSDFDYELQFSLTNRKLASEVDTIFFMTDEKYSYLSSSLVRQLVQFKGDVSAFVPVHVNNALRSKFNE